MIDDKRVNKGDEVCSIFNICEQEMNGVYKIDLVLFGTIANQFR